MFSNDLQSVPLNTLCYCCCCSYCCCYCCTGGVLANAYGELLQALWFGNAPSVAPLVFKREMGRFNTVFTGFAQHDAQVW
jgi:hypothetical protein